MSCGNRERSKARLLSAFRRDLSGWRAERRQDDQNSDGWPRWGRECRIGPQRQSIVKQGHCADSRHRLRIGVHRICTITDEFKRCRSVLIHHEQILFAQSQQSAACDASYLVGARMCCWLLRMRDLADSDNLMLTQKLLAQMIGVRQASVSLVAHALQKADLIKY